MHFKKSCGCRKAPRAYSCNSRCYINSHFAPEYGRLICDTTNPFDKELLNTSTMMNSCFMFWHFCKHLIQEGVAHSGLPRNGHLCYQLPQQNLKNIKIHHRHTSQNVLETFPPCLFKTWHLCLFPGALRKHFQLPPINCGHSTMCAALQTIILVINSSHSGKS